MTTSQLEQLRPWLDGMVTDAGYRPAASLISAGYLRHEFDNFYSLTAKAQREVAALRGIPDPSTLAGALYFTGQDMHPAGVRVRRALGWLP